MKKILIIQPYIPEYRRQFFSMLDTRCKENDMKLTIFAPKPDKLLRLRRDTSSDIDMIREIGVFRFKLIGKEVDYFRLPHGVKFTDFDIVIMEQTLKNIQYPLLLLKFLKNTKIALWGHGRTVVKAKSKFEEFLQLFLSKRADFFFSYTSSGAKYLIENGFSDENLVILQNSNSSFERVARISSGKENNKTKFQRSDLHCCFIGALEETKGINFLLRALPLIRDALPKFQFTFIGDGPAKDLVKAFAETHDYANWLGFKNQSDIDEICENYSLILNPGRVGLIAVDSIFLTLPIVTIPNGYHAPEYEYIKDNGTSVELDGTFEDFAVGVIRLLENPERIEQMQERLASLRGEYTLEIMVENFIMGLKSCLPNGNF